jgi:hypothetical protein
VARRAPGWSEPRDTEWSGHGTRTHGDEAESISLNAILEQYVTPKNSVENADFERNLAIFYLRPFTEMAITTCIFNNIVAYSLILSQPVYFHKDRGSDRSWPKFGLCFHIHRGSVQKISFSAADDHAAVLRRRYVEGGKRLNQFEF